MDNLKLIEHCKWQDILESSEPLSADASKSLDEYFMQFAKPQAEVRCLKCAQPQTGFIAAICGRGFTWGISNGEGYCSTCGWPARALHRDVGPIRFFEFVLQYHPDNVQVKPLETPAEEPVL